MKKVIFQDLKSIDYKKAWDYQEKLFNNVVANKKAAVNPGTKMEEVPAGYLLFCEHPHVYTLGKSGTENNLLIDPAFLDKINATYYRINRGGDITYHGPGQIVGYPIIDLERFGLQVKQYIYLLEESIIETLKKFGIYSSRLQDSTGVWLDPDIKGKSRKICAIGVRASRYVTMHGFAFNVNTDLNYFNYINPCGLNDKGVTSLEKELGAKQDIETVKRELGKQLSALFGFNMEDESK